MRFLAPPIGVAYTSWPLGVKEESEAPAPLEEFIGDAVSRKGPSIRLELQNGCLAGNSRLAEIWLQLHLVEDPAAGRM